MQTVAMMCRCKRQIADSIVGHALCGTDKFKFNSNSMSFDVNLKKCNFSFSVEMDYEQFAIKIYILNGSFFQDAYSCRKYFEKR